MPNDHDLPTVAAYEDGPPTNPRALTTEALLELVLETQRWLVSREQARDGEKGYLRSFAESKVADRIRIDHLAFLVALAAISAGLGVSLPDLWRVVVGGAP